MRLLSAPAIGTLTEFLQHGTLSEQPGTYPDAMAMVATCRTITKRSLAICATTSKPVNSMDMGTNDFLTELMEKPGKTAWMLRAFLQDRS